MTKIPAFKRQSIRQTDTSSAAHPVLRQSPFRRITSTQWLILGTLVITLIAGQSIALYTVFTSKFAGGNDFFVYWFGGREYLLHGTNPYSQEMAEKIQLAVFGRLAGPEDKDQALFANPLYSLYFSWPLSLLPYPWARAVWMTLLQFMLLGLTGLSIWLSGWRPPTWLVGLTLLWGILLYNGARALILGQFSILVGLALILALAAIKQRRDGWAGIFLSMTMIKPQMVILLLIFLLAWAAFQRRWWLIGGFVASMLVLLGSSLLLIPTWPLDFLRVVIEYSQNIAFGTPLENLLHYFLPAGVAPPLTLVLSLLLFLALLPGWWLAWRAPAPDRPRLQTPTGSSKAEYQARYYTWAVLSTLIVGSLITFRSATTNQVILYLPLFFFFYRLSGPKAPLVALLIEIGLLVLMWTVFALTLEGDWENIMLHGLLPALLLLLYLIDGRVLWRTAGKGAFLQ